MGETAIERQIKELERQIQKYSNNNNAYNEEILSMKASIAINNTRIIELNEIIAKLEA